MAVEYDGGVILGADSRTSTGSYVANRVSDKIVPIHDYVWACRSGSAADTQSVVDYVKYYVDGHTGELDRLPRVHTCANLMKMICYENKDNLMAGLICGGWDPYEGGQVYEIPLGGTIVRQKYAIGGSGSSYIYGLVDSTYTEGMTKEECKTFVKKGEFLFFHSLSLLPSSDLCLTLEFCSHFSCNEPRWLFRWGN
jgi:20S proteasome subunit beta 1